jgi:hypothetical protein
MTSQTSKSPLSGRAGRRPAGFFAASRANRRFPFDDYQYEQSRAGASLAVQRWAR